MKVLIYSHAFAPQIGGIETFVKDLARGLACANDEGAAERMKVTVVTQTSGTENAASSEAEAAFQVVRKPGAARLWRLIACADTVLLAGPAVLPLLFALIQRKRTFVSHHGYQSICPNGMLFQFSQKKCCPGHFAARRYWECLKCNREQEKLTGSARLLLLTFVRRALTRLANSNVAVSQHVSERIALPRALVIRNGVPDAREAGKPNKAVHSGEAGKPAKAGQTGKPNKAVLSGEAAKPNKAVHSGSICFAYVGRLVTEKGVNVLIDAASILKKKGCNFRVLIIGDGPERQALQVQATTLGLDGSVEFLGFLNGMKLEDSLSQVYGVIMPSICEDAAPFSALEQLMRGRLIIGSNIGGLAEEIGEAGLTFTPGDASALADRMRQVIEHPELVAQFGALARERALQCYTLERMVLEYRDLLEPAQRT